MVLRHIYTIFVQSNMLPEDVVTHMCTFFSMQDYVHWVQSHHAATSRRAWGKRCFEYARARVATPRLLRNQCHACSSQTCVCFTPLGRKAVSLYCRVHSTAYLRVSSVLELLNRSHTSPWPVFTAFSSNGARHTGRVPIADNDWSISS
jgi:hypothetical protein